MLLPEALREIHVQHRNGYVAEPRLRPMGIELALSGRHKTGMVFPIEIVLPPTVTPTGLYVIATVRRRPKPAAARRQSGTHTGLSDPVLPERRD